MNNWKKIADTLNIYHLTGNVLSILHEFTYLIFNKSLRNRYSYYLYFADEESNKKKTLAHRWLNQLEPKQSGSRLSIYINYYSSTTLLLYNYIICFLYLCI